MNGKTFPLQAIYKGKTKQSLSKVNFSTGFSLNANIQHHSKTQEVLKYLEEIFIPYVDAKRNSRSEKR